MMKETSWSNIHQWMSVRSAARRLGVTRRRVYQLIQVGKLNMRVIHGRMLVSERSVEDRVKLQRAELEEMENVR